MSSAALNNIIKALEIVAKQDKYPLYADMSDFYNLGGLEVLDECRESFYPDEKSRKIFDWLCRYRIIMEAYGSSLSMEMEDSPFSKREWSTLETKAKAMPENLYAKGDYLLDRICVWFLESYAHPPHCTVRQGDIVLDCGAFTGNTSMYFAQKTGPSGRVYGFEPIPALYAQYVENMAQYEHVFPMNCAVSDKEGVISFQEGGAASREKEGADLKVYGLSIDHFFTRKNLGRVDFIKMDVEGAEEKALRGAGRVIRDFRPRMAISVYHNEYDIITIPALIRTMVTDYVFALGHFSPDHNETVLYCHVPG
jgi:FkbM family methyltransferase